jgi:hypothetical protein
MFVSNTSAYPSEGTLLCGKLLALPSNIPLGWKDLSRTNTLAYWARS